LRGKEKYISLFDSHRQLPVVDEESAFTLHQCEELDLVGRREADCPRTSGSEAAPETKVSALLSLRIS